MTTWPDLAHELDYWRDADRTATFWWRDDDAVAPTPALDQLIGHSRPHEIPLALAVIPALTGAPLFERLTHEFTITVLQHGLRHTNYARTGERASEFGPARSEDARLADVAAGWQLLEKCPLLLPVFVPPWNRIDDAVFDGLKRLGFHGVSRYGPRARRFPATGFTELNTHADIIAWKTTRGFAGDAKVLTEIVEHLQARRAGTVDADEPTGLLTHHLVHDPASWTFIETLFEATCRHPAVRWLDAAEAFAVATPGGLPGD